MPVEIIMPKVDMDMSHGTLATWHAAEGEEVRQGAPLFDIETDKAAMEVEAPASGQLRGVLAKPGDKVAVGTILGFICAPGEVLPSPSLVAADAADAPDPVEAVPAPRDARPDSPRDSAASQNLEQGIRATPLARKAARDAGIALDAIVGRGPRGRIQHDDVAAHLGAVHLGAAHLEAAHLEAAHLEAGVATGPATAAAWTPDAGPLSVTRRDGSGAPIVLIHGFAADSQSWAPLERHLDRRRGLIRIDLPGHGGSPRRRIGGFAELARMIAAAFDQTLPAESSAHLVGHSLGAALAVALADIRGRRIASLTLIAPAGLGPEIDADALGGIVRARSAESLAPWLRRLAATPEAIGDDYVRAAMRTRTDPQLRACQADMANSLFPDGTQGFDLRAALARLEMPTQIVWGRRDRILPWRQALAAEGDFGLHLLAGAGHIPQIECPDRVARIIARLVASVEALAGPG